MISLYDLRQNHEDKLVDSIKAQFDSPINVISFSNQSISTCIGCWNCWLKTPGQCVMSDSMSAHYNDYINSDKVILLFSTAQGFINHRAKAFLDRTIPHYHPYIEIVNQECHHVARYDSYPDLYFYFDSEGLTKAEEQVIADYLARSAFHYRSRAFRLRDGSGISIEPLQYNKANRHQIPFASTSPMNKLVIYNGSPRRNGSNSTFILDQVENALSEKVEIRNLKQTDKWSDWAESFPNEENVLFFLPLYVHAMPSHVMAFLEKLQQSEGSISFFVQSGFPESSQSHYLEAYFEQLALRLGRQYLGTVIKGGVESLQTSSFKIQEKIIQTILQSFEHLVKAGSFDQANTNRLAMPVEFGSIISKIIHMFGEKSINGFWDKKLKANGAYESRFDRPYMK